MTTNYCITAAAISLLILSCWGISSCNNSEGGTPKARVALLESQLGNKKAALQTLNAEIADLERQLADLDPEYKARLDAKKFHMVSTQEVAVKKFEQVLDFPATVSTKGNYMLSSEMGGSIVSLTIKEGSKVRKGQTLGRVDDSILNRNMDELNASLRLAENAVVTRKRVWEQDKIAKQKSIEELELSLNLTRDVFKRRKALWDKNIGSEMEYLKAKNDVESLEARLASTKRQVQMADLGSDLEYQQARTNVETLKQKKAGLQIQLDKTKLIAPASGTVEMVMVKQGEMAGPGTPIAQIVSARQVQVAADIPENYVANIKQGSAVLVEVPVLALERKGKISNVGETINPKNRTFKVEVDIQNSDGSIKPNLMANLKIVESATDDAVVVPTNYIMNDATGSYVYIAEKVANKLTAKRVNITTGGTSNSETLVTDGLKGGEQLITEGFRTINNGDGVKVVN